MTWTNRGQAAAQTNRGSNLRSARRARVRVESLEARALLAGTLTLSNAQLVNSSSQPTTPVVGEMIFVRADWLTSGLKTTDQYLVDFTVDGVKLSSSTLNGQVGTNLSYNYGLGGWFASPGTHTVQVSVDGAHAVAGANEVNNTSTFTFTPVAPATLPAKLDFPIGGTPFQDWSIVNYLDVNPLPVQFTDYRGGNFAYDGHNGYDLTLPNFPHMDAGVPVFAAAAGVVTNAQDGNFDRQTGFNAAGTNFVDINLGGGWTTEYYHLLRTSPTVKVGDTVVAGQLLGYVGSSGNSTDAHLHFDIQHNGDLVETFYDPTTYWVNPLPYQGDVAPTLNDQGVSNSTVFADAKERPVSVTTFPVSSGWDVWYWQRISDLKPTDVMNVKWYRPDGALATTYTYTPTGVDRYGFYGWDLPAATAAAFPGTWHVATVVNGNEIGRTSFQETAGAGLPRIKLTQGTTYLVDHRTTPVDFGTATTQLTFTINNVGSATLNTSNPVLPVGYALTQPFPATVSPGASVDFTVVASPSVVGLHFGQIQFTTNDPADPTFAFNVTENLAGSPDPSASVLTLSGRALATTFPGAPVAIDPAATLTEFRQATFNGGNLTVQFVSGGTADDQLSIADHGLGAGTVGFDGSTVTYGGLAIGTATLSGTPTRLTVALNVNATLPALQALIRDVTFADVATNPVTAPRYVQFSVVDGTGLPSNQAVATAIGVKTAVIQTAPTITWATPAAITYGTPLGGSQLDASASVPGSYVYSPALGSVLNAGAGQVLAVLFTPTDAVHFTSATATTTINVLKAQLTVTAANASKVYGAALPALTAAITGFVNGDTAAVVAGAPVVSTTAASSSPVGQYPINVNLGTLAASNYTFTTTAGTLTVAKAHLSVLANSATKRFGAAVPTLTDTLTGFVNGDMSAVVSGAAALATTAVASSAPGAYPITVKIGTLSAANYDFTPFLGGSVIVTEEPADDFLGLGRSQPAVFRPSTAAWTVFGPSGAASVGGFGATKLTDIPVAGDFDGVGHAELAVFRPSTAQWFVLGANGGRLLGTFGAKNLFDIPVPGDYDGTGKSEMAVFRPSTGEWFVMGPNGARLLTRFGGTGLADLPVAGDFDGVGHAEPAVFRVATGQWFVLGPNGGHFLGSFGAPNLFDVPVPGDYDGVGHAEMAVFRPTTGEWFVLGPNGGHLVAKLGSPRLVDIAATGPEGALILKGLIGGIKTFSVAAPTASASAPTFSAPFSTRKPRFAPPTALDDRSFT